MDTLNSEKIVSLLPHRPNDAHKGTFGKVLVIAGSEQYIGAAYLAASAAQHVGAGLVTLAVPESIYAILAIKLTETTFVRLPDSDGAFSAQALQPLIEKIPEYDVVLIGPGLSLKDSVKPLISGLLEYFRAGGFAGTVILDADALTIISQLDDVWQIPEGKAILTPHPAEMGRLLGVTAAEIQKGRSDFAKTLVKISHQTVVLKGAHTLIAAPDGKIAESPFATAVLATAGTGDVLSGAIAGFVAQRLSPFDASCVGVYVHGEAAGLIEEQVGDTGVVASDLLPDLPKAIQRIKQFH